MSHQIKAEYDQIFLFPPNLEDLLSADHPARFVREVVDQLDLKGLGFKVDTNEEGRPFYSSDLLLKVWIFGYFNKYLSSRQLERQCRQDIGLVWLSGMNYPDHNTLWRFWKNNKERMEGVFKQIVGISMKLGLIDMTLNALDGTKLKAYSSNRGINSKKKLEKALKDLDKSIEEMGREIELNEQTEEGSYSLPEKLRGKEQMRKKITEAMEELKQLKRDNMHPKEKEARVMKNSGKRELSYNAQAVVDSKHQIIVGQDVINNENDTESLVPMIKEVVEMTGTEAKLTIADSGYATAEQIHEAERNKYNVLFTLTEKSNISPEGRKDLPYHADNFRYDESKDVMICPENKELEFHEKGKTKNKKHVLRIYKCSHYSDCPVRMLCSKSKTGREVKLNPFHRSVENYKVWHNEPGNEEKLRKRQWLIEPVFGWIKHNDKFRRFTARGIQNAKAQWSMICSVKNLQKMYAIWTRGEIKFS